MTERRNDSAKTEEQRPGGPLERVTVNLTPRSARALETATRITGDSKTDTLNRAIVVYAYLEEVSAAGAEIFMRKPDGEQYAVKLL